jgi:hypothetical protein
MRDHDSSHRAVARRASSSNGRACPIRHCNVQGRRPPDVASNDRGHNVALLSCYSRDAFAHPRPLFGPEFTADRQHPLGIASEVCLISGPLRTRLSGKGRLADARRGASALLAS